MHILRKRIFPGFQIGEALLWLVFDVAWIVILAGFYVVGGSFQKGTLVTPSNFIHANLSFLIVKNILVLPLWWLYFKKLQHAALPTKIILHVFTGLVYAMLMSYSLHYLRTGLLSYNFLKPAVLSKMYDTLIYYAFDFSVLHAYNFYLSTIRQQKREQQLRELAYHSEIRALKAQIEPHFLFNTLNSISASIPPSMEKTRVMIAQLADTFRHALHVSEKNMVPLKEEIDFIKTWLSLEKHRFQDRLQVDYRIENSCLAAKVPPMLLQPIVENALNHGISPKIEGGTVTIECRQDDKFAFIAVCDTGVGYKADLERIFDNGIGLRNISKRLKLLYNQPLTVKQNGQGLQFSFKVPLEITNETKSDSY